MDEKIIRWGWRSGAVEHWVVGFDVVKSAVVLRGGWLVILGGRRMPDLMLLRVQ